MKPQPDATVQTVKDFWQASLSALGPCGSQAGGEGGNESMFVKSINSSPRSVSPKLGSSAVQSGQNLKLGYSRFTAKCSPWLHSDGRSADMMILRADCSRAWRI